MRIAVVQTNPTFGNVKQNVDDAIALMGEQNAELFVLPELFNTGYNFIDKKEVEELAEPVQGNTFHTLANFAQKKSCYIVYGFAERSQSEFYNSAALIGPRDYIGIYRKVHLYNRETLFFAAGNLGFPVFDVPIGKIGIMICFDWMYPESARTLALKGAQLIAHPSNLVMPYCPDAMVTRCLENRVFAATADRVGEEQRGSATFHYIGKSEIVSSKGEILTRLGDSEIKAAVVDVDISLADNKELNRYNNLMRDRKVEQYSL